MKQTIAIVHNRVGKNPLPDEMDVLTQVEAVSRAITNLGYNPVPVACDLDLSALKQTLTAMDPAVVFNLVESLDGHGRLIQVVPALVEALGFAYTGCPAEAVYLTSHKVMAKERMRALTLPTADWINPAPPQTPWQGSIQDIAPSGLGPSDLKQADPESSNPVRTDLDPSRTWIIKSLWEHASLGLEQENLVTGTGREISALLPEKAKPLGGACFAEEFIQGREFNISLMDTERGMRVLPVAEIVFKGFAPDQPKIVGYRAKWMEDAPEYHNTPRSFDFSKQDRQLISLLERMAVECWHGFGLRGYARVDFRVDNLGNPYILEVNTNPCISPDAGFCAALERAGISHEQGIQMILAVSH
ncbi:MAG: D-alanine--D-alanine ligase [Desulfobacterium sp.]|jgi:D-alanine-D-alanine ligase|nr:D-alanine--D-alanine ligase [Desulfobacterium sp.]